MSVPSPISTKALLIAAHIVLIDNSVEPEVILQATQGRISFEATRMPKWVAKVKEFIKKD